MIKHILCYLRGSLGFGLHLRLSTSSSELTVYTDVYWVGCSETRQSTLDYAMLLGVNLVSWSSKR
jgi:hypothetical protein